MTEAFDARMRRRALTEDCPLPVGYEDRLREAVERLPRRSRRRPLRGLLVAAVVCAALAASAVAVSPGLRERLADWLGAFAPYAQEVEGVSVTDQGIRVTVLSTLADREEGWVYLAVTDLEGDRLDGSMNLDYMDYVGGSLQSYDPETRTAVFRRYIGTRNEDGTATIQINEMIPGVVRFAEEDSRQRNVDYEEPVELPLELVTGETLESFAVTVDDLTENRERQAGRIVLVPGQTPADLGIEFFSLSSMGFDENGDFHIQLALAEGVNTEERDSLILFPELTSAILTDGERVEITGVSDVCFGGGKYYDLVLLTDDPDRKIDPARIGELEMAGLCGALSAKEMIRGDWTLTFPLETVAERIFIGNEPVNGMAVDTVTCAVTSVSLQGTSPNGGTPSGMRLGVYLKDGTVAVSERGRPTSHKEAGEGYVYSAVWRLDAPIDPETVTGISIGYWMIPLEGGAAGPGYWLTELPE